MARAVGSSVVSGELTSATLSNRPLSTGREMRTTAVSLSPTSRSLTVQLILPLLAL
ncbi:hypothetical protein D3C78_1986950 [compost metagenome]